MRATVSAVFLLLCLTGCATMPKHPQPPSFDPELTGFPYPFEVHEYAFESQGEKLRMAYMDERPDPWNGQTVVLLHGKNFAGFYWQPTMRALLGRGFRVVVPDQVCFGKSSKPGHYQFSFPQLATNTMALLHSIGVTQPIVVGHSMGGMLAARFALMYPDHTAKLVLVNPIGLEDYQDLVAYRTIDDIYQQELKATPESIREYQRQSYYSGQWKPEYEKLMTFAAGWTRHRKYPQIAWCSALTYDMVVTQPVVHDLPRIRVPTLLIIGQRDRTAVGRAWARPDVAETMGNYPELGKKTAAAIPGAKLVEIPGVGHLPMVEAFDPYMKALGEFLTSPRAP